MQKTNLLGYDLADLEEIIESLGERKYKARQLFKWLYNRRVSDFAGMTDLSIDLRRRLDERYFFADIELKTSSLSSDETEKFLFVLPDGYHIESVLIPDGDKRTVCISSQAGCPLGCRFCATGLGGFGRDLTAGEIVGQMLWLLRTRGDEAFQNIVFMGMGEPLLNLENVLKAVAITSSEIGLSHSAKKVTISTIGLVPQIYKLADSGIKVNLAISLHAADEIKRIKLIPAARKYPLNELMAAARYFARKRRKRITFEYILFEGLNDGPDDALELAALVRGIPCKINILVYNPVPGLSYRRPGEERVNEFVRTLYPRAPAVTVRKSRGLDIDAACGQLAGKYRKL